MIEIIQASRFLLMLDAFINPQYLNPDNIENIRQAVLAKPVAKYATLDNFFREDWLAKLIERHEKLQFSEELDRRSRTDGAWLPYDGAVVFAQKDQHFGSDLFYSSDWHNYLCSLVSANIASPVPEIKLRYHRPMADGFWIHTDSVIREVVCICYFNKHWLLTDGGLLQIWRMDEELSQRAYRVHDTKGRLDFLNNHRIQTAAPGGGFPDGRVHDLVLVDQIVPAYNRVFVCNLQANPTYHSVTPSGDRARLGFVQWLHEGRRNADQRAA
jgi:hypothetical protein